MIMMMVGSDQWAAVLNDERWSWSGLLPFFKKSETFFPSKNLTGIDYSKNHGFNGPIKVRDISLPISYPSSLREARRKCPVADTKRAGLTVD